MNDGKVELARELTPKERVEVEFGADLCEFVMSKGMAGEAAKHLAKQLRGNGNGTRALKRIIGDFNAIGSAYAAKMGWTAERIAECDAAILAAYGEERKVIQLH